jgi:CheY-like chemotaxis protein
MLNKPAVLVVEDEPLIRFTAADAVEDLGCRRWRRRMPTKPWSC